MRRHAPLLPLLVLAACAGRTSVPVETYAPTYVMDSAFLNHVAFVRGRIADSGPLWFLIDTGANRSALDLRVARRLGLATGDSTTVHGSAGTIAVPAARLPGLRLGGLEIGPFEPVVYDLSGSLAPGSDAIAGILGGDVLGDHAVLFDTSRGQVAFSSSAHALAGTRDVTAVPFELDNGIPRVEASINGVPLALRLDTGASIGPGPITFVNITDRFYRMLKTAEPDIEPIRHFTATGTGGEVRIPVVQGRTFVLGHLRIPDPQLIVQPPVGYFAGPDAVGFVGAYTLQDASAFIVDYPGRRLLLIP